MQRRPGGGSPESGPEVTSILEREKIPLSVLGLWFLIRAAWANAGYSRMLLEKQELEAKLILVPKTWNPSVVFLRTQHSRGVLKTACAGSKPRCPCSASQWCSNHSTSVTSVPRHLLPAREHLQGCSLVTFSRRQRHEKAREAEDLAAASQQTRGPEHTWKLVLGDPPPHSLASAMQLKPYP